MPKRNTSKANSPNAPRAWKDVVKAARAARGWSKNQLATYLGVHRSTITRWEAGTRVPGAWVQEMIERIMLA